MSGNDYGHQFNDYSSVAPSYSGFDQSSYNQPKPEPKPEPGVKFRPLAFYDQIEPVLRTSKIPGNGSRGNGTTFYIRIERPDMEKFISGQVSRSFIFACLFHVLRNLFCVFPNKCFHDMFRLYFDIFKWLYSITYTGTGTENI